MWYTRNRVQYNLDVRVVTAQDVPRGKCSITCNFPPSRLRSGVPTQTIVYASYSTCRTR
jgi:hypothetical protein